MASFFSALLVVLQPEGVAFRIIEGEVDIMGKVGEYIFQMRAQGISQQQLGLSGQLCLKLCGDVRYQAQLIGQLCLCPAITQVVVDGRASRQ